MDALSGGLGRPFHRLSDRVGVNTVPVLRSYQPGTYTFTAEVDGVHVFYLWGGGGFGAGGGRVSNNAAYATGGGSGGFVKKTIELKKGDVVSLSIGRGSYQVTGGNFLDAQDTTASLPGGVNLVAGRGSNGSTGAALVPLSGVGGIATGGDLNVPGSKGGDYTNSGAGVAGTNGGLGGTGGQASGGGGGAPGDGTIKGGAGGIGVSASYGTQSTVPGGGPGQTPGGGGGAGLNTSTGGPMANLSPGGDGLVLVIYQKEAPL